jgi:hypothetical protein
MNDTLQKYSRGIVAAAILLIAAVVIWWQAVYVSPQRVFDDMLANNLSTSSVTKNEISTTNGTTLTQRINLQLGGNNSSRWFVTVQQKTASVTTDSIGTPTTGYVRYTQITPAKDNPAVANVLGVWAMPAKGDTNSALPNLFSNSHLDLNSAPVPPVGNLTPSVRANMLSYIKTQNVFAADYSKVKKSVISGRQVDNFPVSVKLAPYIRLMQAFAGAYGLKQLDRLSANQYQTAAPVKLTIAVDRLSHQMVRVTYAPTGFNETYTDYGIARPVTLPTHTITEAALQQRVSQLQK